MGNPGDSPPPTPEMLIIEPLLTKLITPVARQLQDLGVEEVTATFAAYRAVWGVLNDIVADDLDVKFIVEHQEHGP